MKYFFMLLLVCQAAVLNAQNIKVTGIIIDAVSKEPVSNVSISIKGKAGGTTSDQKGNFNLTISRQQYPFTIEFSSVNYESKELQLTEIMNQFQLSWSHRNYY